MAPTDFLTYLDVCVSTTEQCSSSLSTSTSKLQPGVSDLPRLTRILKNVHHYLVLPQPTVQAHKTTLSQHLAPQIDTLISKAESLIEAQNERVKRLEERLSIIQSARIPQLTPSVPAAEPELEDEVEDEGAIGASRLDGIDLKELNPVQRRKVAMLRGKRNRLEDEWKRLKEGE